VPFDRGTSGSRSTPSMVPQIRKVAATARELLKGRAAELLKVDPASITIADGQATHAPSGRKLSFGDLAKGAELAQNVEGSPDVRDADQWQVQGTSVPKVDGRSFVTGRHLYTSDITRPGMLHGKVLRPASLNATLANIDLSGAKALPNVTAVHDGNFVGVTAASLPEAEQAVKAISAEWTKSASAIADAQLFEALRRPAASSGSGGRNSNSGSGSIGSGLAEADHTLEATYTIAYIAHAPLEPRAAVAEWNDGRLTVWTGTQQPFRVRDNLAEAFGVGREQVRVIVPDTGSGYGGKHSGEAAIEAARLAKAAGKPVKLIWTREEEFTWAYFRPAGVIDVKAGVRNDGKITAWEFHNYNSGGSAIRPLYDIANQKSQFHQVESPLRQGSYRALASTANHFARESHIDDLAAAVKIDPLAFRLQNLTHERLRGVFEAAAKAFGWNEDQPAADRGFGIAGGEEKGSYVATCAELAIDRSQNEVRVVRLVTAYDCGAIVNPDQLTNQVEGAVTMGLGGALFEAIQFADDRIMNPKFARYRVPRFSDLPELKTVLVNRKDLPSAGAGETPIVAVAPAIGNAIRAATGIRLKSLPMVPNGLPT
jgi:isoquinoline 1-oxidoreductase